MASVLMSLEGSICFWPLALKSLWSAKKGSFLEPSLEFDLLNGEWRDFLEFLFFLGARANSFLLCARAISLLEESSRVNDLFLGSWLKTWKHPGSWTSIESKRRPNRSLECSLAHLSALGRWGPAPDLKCGWPLHLVRRAFQILIRATFCWHHHLLPLENCR